MGAGQYGVVGSEADSLRLRCPGERVQRLHVDSLQLGPEPVRILPSPPPAISPASPWHDHLIGSSGYVRTGIVLNSDRTSRANSHSIHPFLHSFSNHRTTENLLRRVDVPDTCPSDVLGQGKGGDFSLVAGDFEEIYSDPSQAGQWASVVTCFFIDTVCHPHQHHYHYQRLS